MAQHDVAWRDMTHLEVLAHGASQLNVGGLERGDGGQELRERERGSVSRGRVVWGGACALRRVAARSRAHRGARRVEALIRGAKRNQ